MDILRLLNSPEPVAWFQYLCGVRWKNPDQKRKYYPVDIPCTSNSLSETKKQQESVILYKTFFFLAKAGTELAGEPFYYVFFPACAWIFKIQIARRTLLMLATSMYIGQSLKDILRRPRPASPPVIRLEALYETEYGMPSTHTMAGVTASFSLLLFSSQLYEVPVHRGILFASLWSSAVMISRIYLGMHSLLETLTGAILSFAILGCTRPIINWFEEFQMSSGILTSVCVGVGSILLAKIIFMLDADIDETTGLPRWNTARGDTAEILGWCAGFLIGSKYAVSNNFLQILSGHGQNLIPVSEIGSSAMRCLLRFSAGALILGPSTLLLRQCLKRIFIVANGLSNMDEEDAKRNCSVELPYKFFTTFLSGFVSTYIIPAVLQNFNMW